MRLAAQVEPKGSLQGMTAPKADAPQLMTLQGEFVRMAYNNEGYAILQATNGTMPATFQCEAR